MRHSPQKRPPRRHYQDAGHHLGREFQPRAQPEPVVRQSRQEDDGYPDPQVLGRDPECDIPPKNAPPAVTTRTPATTWGASFSHGRSPNRSSASPVRKMTATPIHRSLEEIPNATFPPKTPPPPSLPGRRPPLGARVSATGAARTGRP